MQDSGASRRIKSLYSVIANLSRLEILKILNSHGPLTYSELKSLAGFKSKKESGKFAYHLRKLVRQNLVSLDRGQRKYLLTSLGRSVLNLNRQIEEQTLFESGKLYVRTSKHRIEPFNADKILQSLVKEANMPLELAQRITNEIENRLYRIQAHYLTAPLIREMVNALLIEQGYEVYRQRLTRLGKPVYDVSEMINSIGAGEWGMDELKDAMAGSILSEYLLLIQITRDIADLHFSGSIHLSKVDKWSFMPDTIFVNLSYIFENGFNLGYKIPSLPRISKGIKDSKELIKNLCSLTSLISREVNSEVCFIGLDTLLNKLNLSMKEEEFRLLFDLLSISIPQISSSLIVSFLMEENLIEAIKGYEEYSKNTPYPKLTLILPTSSFQEMQEEISQALAKGNSLAFISNGVRSYKGIKQNQDNTGVTMNIHSLTINLPRIGYESGKDEIYFRAKLYITLQNSLTAIIDKKRLILENLNRKLLPFLSSTYEQETIHLIVNLIGLEETALAIIGENMDLKEYRNFSRRFVEETNKLMDNLSSKYNEKINFGLIEDEASKRFFYIDQDKYGNYLKLLNKRSYSEGITLREEDINNLEALNWAEWMLNNIRGGCNLLLKVNSEEVLKKLPFSTGKLSFLRVLREIRLCPYCGNKVIYNLERCNICGSKLNLVTVS